MKRRRSKQAAAATVTYGPHRVCHFCGERIETDTAVQARTGNAWAHFSCWYDGSPVRNAEGKIV